MPATAPASAVTVNQALLSVPAATATLEFYLAELIYGV